MTAAAIQAITNPLDLFDLSQLDTSYKRLVKQWHPDVSHDTVTFLHIQQLYAVAKQYSADTIVVTVAEILDTVTNSRYPFYYTAPFELGTIYVGDTHITYKLQSAHATKKIPTFPFSSDAVKKEFSRQVPVAYVERIAADGSKYLIISKTPSSRLLQEVLSKNTIPIETTLWLFNRLYNLSCYMSHQGLLQYGLNESAIVVDFAAHTIFVPGGWWYTYAPGATLSSMPVSTLKVLSNNDLTNKKARVGAVLDQIKACILRIQPTHPILRNWCQTPSTDDSVAAVIAEYSYWDTTVLPKIVAKRTFYTWIPK